MALRFCFQRGEVEMKNECIAEGVVEALAIDGKEAELIHFSMDGPRGDVHASRTRKLSGHDGAYIRTSALTKGDFVLNWRSWTGLATEEVIDISTALAKAVPVGALLENIRISGVPHFSQLAPTTRLVFPRRAEQQVILAVWEENGPCKTVGERLRAYHNAPQGMIADFIKAANGKRGVMGLVLSPGIVMKGDAVRVYPPVT
ncbi:MAG: hypothetical protein RLZZ234_488 [Candidatus Parcubacteria bacterium]|jgi:hypothetical protein